MCHLRQVELACETGFQVGVGSVHSPQSSLNNGTFRLRNGSDPDAVGFDVPSKGGAELLFDELQIRVLHECV